MKILMLGWELPPHNSGGMGEACLSLSHALAEEGADIDFVVPYVAPHPEINFMQVLSATKLDPLYRYGWGAYDSRYCEEMSPSEVIEVRGGKGFVTMRQVQHEYCRFVERYLRRHHPDLVHAHDWLTLEAGILAKKKFGVPLIAHVHATEFDRAGNMQGGNQLVHEIEYEGLMMADKIFAVSEATKRLVHEKYKIPLEKIDVAYNALPESFWRADYSWTEDNFPYLNKLKQSGYHVVASLGRLTIQKGLPHLLHAAQLALARDPKLMFVLAGDGDARNELIAMAADYGVAENVIFTGFLRGKQRRDVYAAADIFVMSSLSEPFGLTALEAAHHGDVLVLTKQSGVAEILRSALTYDFWDDEKLADLIVAVSTNEGLEKQLREDISHEYAKISWHDVARQCLDVYKKVAKRGRK